MKLTREVDIFQCPVSTKYCFCPIWMAKGEVNIEDYVRVWNGLVEIESLIDADEEVIQQAICEKCFDRFQEGRDKTFFGRSLTTSDTICVTNGNVLRYFYCDTVGWKLIKIQHI